MEQTDPTPPTSLEPREGAQQDLATAISFLLITESPTGELLITSSGENPFIKSIARNIEGADKRAQRAALTKPAPQVGLSKAGRQKQRGGRV